MYFSDYVYLLALQLIFASVLSVSTRPQIWIVDICTYMYVSSTND